MESVLHLFTPTSMGTLVKSLSENMLNFLIYTSEYFPRDSAFRSQPMASIAMS